MVWRRPRSPFGKKKPTKERNEHVIAVILNLWSHLKLFSALVKVIRSHFGFRGCFSRKSAAQKLLAQLAKPWNNALQLCMSEIPTVSAEGLSHCSDAELCNLEQNRLFVATGATPVLLSQFKRPIKQRKPIITGSTPNFQKPSPFSGAFDFSENYVIACPCRVTFAICPQG